MCKCIFIYGQDYIYKGVRFLSVRVNRYYGYIFKQFGFGANQRFTTEYSLGF